MKKKFYFMLAGIMLISLVYLIIQVLSLGNKLDLMSLELGMVKDKTDKNSTEINGAFDDITYIANSDLNVLFNIDMNEFGFKYHKMQADFGKGHLYYWQERMVTK